MIAYEGTGMGNKGNFWENGNVRVLFRALVICCLNCQHLLNHMLNFFAFYHIGILPK